MPQLISLLSEVNISQVSRFTGVSEETLINIVANNGMNFIRGDILRKLYRYFGMEIDDFYVQNVENHPRRHKHEGIIGEIFRQKREINGLTIANVARIIRVSETTIERLERNIQLPKSSGWTIQKLLLLYSFSEIEKEYIINAIDSIRNLRKIKIKTP